MSGQGGGGVGLGGQVSFEQRSEVFVKNKKNVGRVQVGGAIGSEGGGGVKVDVNKELKFL